ncbi:MAG: RraA family protein [Sphingopyxis sp.]|uniref:RraA family protein n=1 Tax=Sphingopyxis sp. TaxID=1908224 RepID=UPI001A3203D5|nr:RraA family protein [Sphingopyxis sp.]MBJ7499751.1 RraA family protein [Sphingopyxis sp.]
MIGLSVHQRTRSVTDADIERFRTLPVANVSDVMNRIPAAGPSLRPMHRAGILAGRALTVRTRPGDNLLIHKALDMAEPGDVIVADAGGDLTNALIGELMVAYAKKKGVAGFVLNGAIRDYGSISQDDFPIFAAGVTHRGPYKDGPGEVNVLIAMGSLVIKPGDLILGDEDGVVAVPIDDVDAVYQAAHAKHLAETAQLEAISAGKNDRRWVDQALAKLGCTGLSDGSGQ